MLYYRWDSIFEKVKHVEFDELVLIKLNMSGWGINVTIASRCTMNFRGFSHIIIILILSHIWMIFSYSIFFQLLWFISLNRTEILKTTCSIFKSLYHWSTSKKSFSFLSATSKCFCTILWFFQISVTFVKLIEMYYKVSLDLHNV